MRYFTPTFAKSTKVQMRKYKITVLYYPVNE